MDNLIKYAHQREKDPLVQLAIFFAQLLIIHPFMDGNGRVARICIPLFLYKKKLIAAPIFYMSPYFKRHRLSYFTKLYEISDEDKWEEWIEFFLKGIVEQGKKNIRTAKALSALYEKTCNKYGKKMAKRLFSKPIFRMKVWGRRLKKDGMITPYRNKKSHWAFIPLIRIVKRD